MLMNYRNTLPFDEPELRRWLGEEYNVVAKNIEVRPGYMSTVAFVDTSTERFVLKCVKNDVGLRERLLTQIALLDHLKAGGSPVATCVVGRNEERIFVVDEYSLSMWTFLVGESFLTKRRQQIVSAGEALGQLHQSMLNWQNVDGQMPSFGWSEWVLELKLEWRVLEGSCAEGKALVNCLEAHLAQWEAPRETEPRIVIHNDFRAQNLVFQEDIVSGVFDLDGACLAPRFFDVAYSLIFFQAVVADRPFDEPEMCDFFKGYHQVFPVETNAHSAMSPWLGFALLRGLTLWGRIAYVDQVNDRPKVWIEAYIPLLGRIERIAKKLQSLFAG
jgi:homoserine kinase type II